MLTTRCSLALCLVLVVSTACCGSPGGDTAPTQAALEIEPPDSATLPTITAGGQYVETVTLRSVGAGQIVVTQLELERTDDGPEATLSLVGDVQTPFSIEPGASRAVEILYRPQAGGLAPSAILHVDSTDEISGPQQIVVSAQQGAGRLSVDPTNLSWADVDLFEAKPVCDAADAPLRREFVLTNTGQDAANIREFTLDPADQQANFTVCPVRFEGDAIPPGATRSWSALFHPQAPGDHTVRVEVLTITGASVRVTMRGSTD